MIVRRSLILLIVSLTVIFTSPAQTTDRLSESKPFYFYSLEDKSGTLTSSQVWTDTFPDHWKPFSINKTINFGLSKSVFWIRYPVPTDTALNYLLFKSSLIDFLDVYVKSGNVENKYELGDRRPFANRPISYRQFAVPFKHIYGAPPIGSVLIRVATHDGLYESLPMQILSERVLKDQITRDSFMYGLYFGLILYLLVLSTVLFFVLGDKTQFLFIAYTISFALWSLIYCGFADMFFWPQNPISNTWIMISVLIFSTSMTLFSLNFLSLNKINPLLDKTIKIIILGMTVSVIPLIIFDYYQLFFILFMSIIAVILILLTISSVLCIKKKTKESYFYAISWSLNFFGSFLYIAKVFGIVPSTILTDYTMHIGTIFQAIVLLIGVIVRVYTIQKQTKHDLEVVVAKRTCELRTANEQLRKLSSKDPLTGLYNRRHFLERFTIVAKINNRGSQNLSVMILDIDFFKQFNDTYGHIEGDHCLQKVALTLLHSLPRKSDFCARYGGEEFVICLPGTDADGAKTVAERIRTNIEELRIPHANSTAADVVTISIGVFNCITDRSELLDYLLQNADQALYLAKKNGRNQVQMSVENLPEDSSQNSEDRIKN